MKDLTLVREEIEIMKHERERKEQIKEKRNDTLICRTDLGTSWAGPTDCLQVTRSAIYHNRARAYYTLIASPDATMSGMSQLQA